MMNIKQKDEIKKKKKERKNTFRDYPTKSIRYKRKTVYHNIYYNGIFSKR